MTKRWLSLVLVLMLLASCFTGAAAADFTPKGVGTAVITFVPYQTSYDVDAGDNFQGKAIGYFLADGRKPTGTEIATITGSSAGSANITVVYNSAATTTMVLNGSNADLIVTTPAFVAGEKKLSVSSTKGDGVDGLDFRSLNTAVEIRINAVQPIISMGNITWYQPTSVVDTTLNTIQTGTETSAVFNDSLYVIITPAQPETSPDEVVVWTSNNPSVLSVTVAHSTTGAGDDIHFAKVKAIKPGTAIVTAKTADGKFTKTMTIKVVDVLPEEVSITTPISPKAGEKTSLELTWTTTNPTIKTGTWSIVKATTAGGVAITPASQAATIDAKTGVLTAILDGARVYVRFVADARDANGAVVQTLPITGTELTIAKAVSKVSNVTATYSLGETKDAVLTVGPHKGTIAVKLDTATVGAQIYYTLNNTAATAATGLPYNPNSQIAISQSTILRAIAVKGSLTASNELSATITIDPAITGITLASDTTTITGTDKATVTATLVGTAGVLDANKVNTWALSNNAKFILAQPGTDANVRTIVATGAAKDGDTVKLTVTNNWDPTKKAEITLTYKAALITGITLNMTSATIAANGQVELKATIAPVNTSSTATVTWFSSNTTAATVVAGVVTGVASGSTIIRATVTDNGMVYTAQCTVTVTPPTTQVAAPEFTVIKDANGNNISVDIISSTKDAKVTFTYTTNGTDPTDPVANAILATTPNPLVFVANTSYRIKAIAADGILANSGIASFTVDSNVAVKGVKLTAAGYDAATKTLTVSGLTNNNVLTATLNPLDPKIDTMSWVSSAPAVVKVTPSTTVRGIATATIETLAIGTSTITVTTADGSFSDTITVRVVNVSVDINGVSVSPSTVFVPAGNYVELVATVLPAELPNKNVTWSSNRPGVANVDANGKVTALVYDATLTANNIVAITATSVEKDAFGNAVNAVAMVHVTAPAVDVAPLSFWTKNATTGALVNAVASPAYTVETEFVLKTATDGAEIYYTTNGTEPSRTNGLLFSGSFKLSETSTIKAIAYKGNMNVRPVANQYVTFDLKVTEITVSKSTATIEVGDTLTITYDFLPMVAATGKTVTGIVIADSTVVSNTHDATMKSITFTGLKAGTTRVTLTNGDSTADAVIEIAVKTPAGLSIEVVGGDVITMGIGEIKTLVTNLLPTKITNQTINWALSAASAATDVVTLNGAQVTAHKAGTVKLVATSAYNSTITKEVTVTVKADPAVIPALPTQIPVYTASSTVFTALAGDKLTRVVGTLAAGTGETYEQISYYYNVNFTETTAVGATFSIDDRGDVTMNIANVGAVTTYPKPIEYKWTLTAKTNRSGNTALNNESRTFTGSLLTVNEKPTTDELSVAAAKDAINKLNVTFNMAYARTEAEAKAALLAELNKAIAHTGIVLNDSDVIVTNYVGATDYMDGSFNYTVNLKSGNATDTATGTVWITHVVPTAAITVNSKTPYFRNSAKRWVLALADGTVYFSVPGYNVTNWKSSKPKVVCIDANGVATLKKKGVAVKITATVNGKKMTQVVNVSKVASEIKLQYKQGKKWVDFDTAPMTLMVGKKYKIKTRIVVVEPAKGGKMFGLSWTMGDTTIATRNSTFITGLSTGITTVTVLTHDGTTATGIIYVVANKGIEDIALELDDTEVEAEDEVIEEDEVAEEDEVIEEDEVVEEDEVEIIEETVIDEVA